MAAGIQSERQALHFELNGNEVSALVDPFARLIDVLRDALGQTGTKEGCGEGECGACTVIVDGRTVNSCLYPALDAEGRKVITIEGLMAPGGGLSPVQRAFVEGGGIQCGFCTPGMILSATSLFERHPDPDDESIREALVGNLCRCTGYLQIFEAIRAAARPRHPAGEHL
jgi:carbon-monoxide dehydrogenase small subunit